MVRRAFDGAPPLDQAGFLGGVDLLACPDQTCDDAPTRDALGEFDEELGLGSIIRLAAGPGVLPTHLFGIPGALSLVEHEEVFGRNRTLPLTVVLDVVLHVPDENLSASTGFLQGILENLDQGPVAG